MTDANLVAGRIPPDAVLGDLGRLDAAAASQALSRRGLSAADVLGVVNANMIWALRQVTVERGVDPSRVALVAFGGAGPLHACDLAEALGMPAVVVPPRAGALSAVGILAGQRQHDVVKSWPTPRRHDGLEAAGEELARSARSALGEPAAEDGGVEVTVSYDCRYAGQSHELTVSAPSAFHEEHRLRNGYSREGEMVEVVALRARASRPSPVALSNLPAPRRRGVDGPEVIAEADSGTWIPPGSRAEVGEAGAWVIRRKRGGWS